MLSQILGALDLELHDAALLFGSLSFLAGLLILGVSGNLHKRRWLARMGWMLSIGGIMVAAFGMFHGTPAPPSA